MSDLIDRQAAIDAQPKQDREFMKLTVRNSNGRPYYSIIYLEFDDNGVGHDFEGYSSYSLDVISDYLKKYFMPSAQPERKKGKWIYEGVRGRFPACRCSVCGNVENADWAMISGKVNYCPNCGADMRGKEP